MTKRLISAVLAAALLLVAACDKTPQPPMVFAASPWAGYEPVYLARELNYLQGANLRLDGYGSASEVDQAFRNHTAHLAAVTLDRALLLRRDIPDLKIILLFDAELAGAPASAEKPESARKSDAAGRMDVLVTRDEYIGQYHREMQQLLQGWRRALDYIHSNPDKAVQIMAQREHITPSQFNLALQNMELYGWQRNQQLMIGEPAPIGGAIESAQRALLRQGKLNMGVDTSMLLEPTLLAEPAK